MRRQTFISVALVCHFSILCFAQSMDGEEYGMEKDKFRMDFRPIPMEPVRQADMFWQKRVIREIDVNEKLNLPFKYAQLPLIKVFQNAVCSGDVIVYDADADMFSKHLYKTEACNIGEVTNAMELINPTTFEQETKGITIPHSMSSIVKYRLIEDWYFDKKQALEK